MEAQDTTCWRDQRAQKLHESIKVKAEESSGREVQSVLPALFGQSSPHLKPETSTRDRDRSNGSLLGKGQQPKRLQQLGKEIISPPTCRYNSI